MKAISIRAVRLSRLERAVVVAKPKTPNADMAAIRSPATSASGSRCRLGALLTISVGERKQTPFKRSSAASS